MAYFKAHTIALFCFLYLNLIQNCFSKQKFFTEISKELRCVGCDLTIKVLDRMLKGADKKSLEQQVDESLDLLCQKDRFSITEYNPEKMVKVCEFMKEYHSGELKRELMDHYSQPEKPTYLQFSQHICLSVMKLCAGVSHKWQDNEDPLVHFDDDFGFTVVPGPNVRMPNPIKEHHDEL